jgi:hypothetical protein
VKGGTLDALIDYLIVRWYVNFFGEELTIYFEYLK